MLAARRQSMASPGPLSPSSLPRPHSSTGHHNYGQPRTRLSSDAASVAAAALSDVPETRNVKVVLRVRPSYPDDASIPARYRSVLVHPTSETEIRVDVDPATLAGHAGTVGSSKKHPTFTFDNVLGEDSAQTDLYDVTAGENVDEFMKGHNVTFLAYGQTSSGKSYSMGTTGEDTDYSGTDFTPRTGLIPRTVQIILERAEESKQQAGPGASWEARISFLELYNEEIIDLLSGTGISISIREERDGRIVWSGVREAKVKSLAEVMQLLQEGSARRKTSETNMNSSSSRSHAIFSLTLVQKRMAGPMSSAVASSRSETPTRQLRRPSSMMGISSAGSARSPTPTSGRGGGPPSSFGRMTPSRPTSVIGTPTGADDYIIVTSKFNMVDLAGSERLKRTAAQGDRMKEGISINSGLLALGNVISTLCDPVKARGHIPYRDSKLTRMLQDSIGGNALTTMIACVSPIEANIGETLNTIKYASRARNIRNQTKVNAVEAGWDDVEHLQTTVLKLRKQISMLESDSKGSASEGNSKHSEKLIQRLAELQREHTELYDRYLAKCSDNMRLGSELRNRGPGDGDALSKFNETVEPVILEYEKVVSALNQQLDELRGEIVIMNDLSEEHNRQLEEARERQLQSESYVTELRSRLTKLTERNTSSEAYIQDLEAKLKMYADKEESHADAVAELKKDISKLREDNASSVSNAQELEAKLSKSEAASSKLVAQVEKQEEGAQVRESAYRELEAHIVRLEAQSLEDSKRLLGELSDRDDKILELEEELEKQRLDGSREKELLEAVNAEKAAQQELRSRLASMQKSASGVVTPPSEGSTPAGSVIKNSAASSNGGEGEPIGELEQLRAAFEKLAAEHAKSESHIADLTSQLPEAKLVQGEMEDTMPLSPSSPTIDHDSHSDDELEEVATPVDDLSTPARSAPGSSPTKRRTSSASMRRSSLPLLNNGVAVKTGFRGGRGYSDSTRIRPQSLSQELSSAQSSVSSPRATWRDPNTEKLLSSPSMVPKPSSKSLQSLEAELRFVHGIVDERDEELRDREAYIRQLEEQLELSKTHDILSRKNRANPIDVTTSEIKSIDTEFVELPRTPETPGIQLQPSDFPLPPSPAPMTPFKSLKVEAGGQDGDDEGLKPPPDDGENGGLSPRSVKRFSQLAESLSRLESKEGSNEQDMIQELMREMAEKEASQRRIIEQQFIQIADLQKSNNKLKEELIGVEPQLSSIQKLRSERDLLTAEQAATSPLPSPVPSPSRSIHSLASSAALDRLQEEHSEDLQSLITGHSQTIKVIQQEHQDEIAKLQAIIEKNEAVIEEWAAKVEGLKLEHHGAQTAQRLDQEAKEAAHQKQLDWLKADHAEILASLKDAHARALQDLQSEQDLIAQEMESSLSSSEEQRRQLKMKADQALFELSRVRDEHSLQRNGDAKQISELTKANAQLEKVKTELEHATAELKTQCADLKHQIGELKSQNGDLKVQSGELSKRASELEQRFSRKFVPPPQVPPPTTALPPLPRSPSGHGNRLGSDGASITPSMPQIGETVGQGRRQSESSTGHSDGTGEGGNQAALYSALAERDGLRDALAKDKERIKEIASAICLWQERKLQEEKVKISNLTVDLREAQKQANTIRSHLDEARQENKRSALSCREHTSELEARREQMAKLADQERNHRESLQAAQAQVASLKLQLERAVETKVQKRGFMCF
ncbi:hypothetical protein, variant [Cryptococcus amylolentus CBS 6039]|uniref:Kinesin motor domain-containing protein n=1 Tax=Cryptococcus amylolentus CBS 6039 TaxID=1295533 RepID=A0A1E3I0Q3_9TREE|nr:hypothetical protein L202_02446 [Cryptococcus amylolentus CBS 6039]XP_018996466.1 hypothetical protein, variant [Cryptococcus amylolentus CBS 6039]ODN82146.1 hypothetical protein L202_02446 [Cryptococcus amylolentus CBS 6039]ODN82147.1 hypothetical protein, variant [Cryptococcus amylolentus CBS 6039]